MARTTERKTSAGGLLAILILGTIGAGFIYGAVKRFAPANPGSDAAQLWADYAALQASGGDMPGTGRIGQMRDACLSGLPGTGALGDENPGYGNTDALGRATAAWVCVGNPVAVAKKTCDYPTGTGEATYRVGWVQGHLVSFQFGGDGTRRDSGGCVDITPQTGSVNAKIRDNPERYAKTHPSIFYIAVPHYRADDSLSQVEAAKPDTLYYFAFSEAGAAPVAAWTFSNFPS